MNKIDKFLTELCPNEILKLIVSDILYLKENGTNQENSTLTYIVREFSNKMNENGCKLYYSESYSIVREWVLATVAEKWASGNDN